MEFDLKVAAFSWAMEAANGSGREILNRLFLINRLKVRILYGSLFVAWRHEDSSAPKAVRITHAAHMDGAGMKPYPALFCGLSAIGSSSALHCDAHG